MKLTLLNLSSDYSVVYSLFLTQKACSSFHFYVFLLEHIQAVEEDVIQVLVTGMTANYIGENENSLHLHLGSLECSPMNSLLSPFPSPGSSPTGHAILGSSEVQKNNGPGARSACSSMTDLAMIRSGNVST